MITISVYQITPFIAEGRILQVNKKNNRTDWLRAAINVMMNRNKASLIKAGVDIDLFHNHDTIIKQNKTGYPKIQYLRKQNLYFVSGIDEGKFALEQLFSNCNQVVAIHDWLNIKSELICAFEHFVEVSNDFYRYTLTDWLPFSDKSDKEYKAIQSLTGKDIFLEKRLKNHLVKEFCRYLKFNFNEEEIEVNIKNVDSYSNKVIEVEEDKHIKRYQPFSILFQTNLKLPEFISLGNKKVYGFGILEPVT